MAVPTVAVTAVITDQSGAVVPGARISATLNRSELYAGFVVASQVAAITDATGTAILNLFPNQLGSQGSQYTVKIVTPNGKTLNLLATVPNAPCNLFSIASLPAYPGKPDSQIAIDAAITAAGQASTSSAAAAASEAAALAIYGNVTAMQTAVNTTAANATSAANSATLATASAGTASTAATSAGTSATSASDSAVSALASASEAGSKSLIASTAATSAGNSAIAATTQATAAESAATTATTQAGIATDQATNSANSAATSVTNAMAAAGSATSAVASASDAAISSENAATSATSASNSASSAAAASANASGSASGAAISTANAESSASAAATSAISAETSAISAANLATSITTAANAASTQAASAADSANSASSSATAAISAATAAHESQAAALISAEDAAANSAGATAIYGSIGAVSAAVAAAASSASSAGVSATAASASAATAILKAAEALASAQTAVAVVTGGTASLVPAAGKIPIANAAGKIDAAWFSGASNDIGLPGMQGFGVGICPAVPAGFSPMSGTSDPASDNYGNYTYTDGSVMVWVPAFFYKYGTGANGLAVNQVSVKSESSFSSVAHATAEGYALHRAFYDGGNIQAGVFVDKYKCSNNNGTASSIRGGNPLSTAAANNPIGGLTGAPANAYYGVIAAAKTRGANFFPGSIFINKMLALLALAHAQASTSTTWCAWYHATNNFPKGCNNNALGDANDAAILYVSAGNATYPAAPKTGSANQFAKTTHNGQNCGIADLNGVIYEICIGLTTQIPTSTAAGYTSDATGFAIGTTSIPLITGTGTVVAGDMITFAGDTNQYAVTTGIAAPGTIVIAAPGLKAAIPAAATAVSIVPASYYLPKTSVAMKSLTSGRTVSTDAWGSPALSANFDNLGTTYGALWATGANRATPIGSASQVFDAATSGNAWAATGAGLPLAAGVGGTNAFGNDYLYDYKPNDMCPLAAFAWNNGATAGVWALYLHSVRGTSSNGVGFRAALYL